MYCRYTGCIRPNGKGKYGIFSTFIRNRAAAQCARIARNPVYAGVVRLKDLEYAGKHEALVSQELWQKVNDRLAANKKVYKRMCSNSDGLLSGLLFCGDCGARMSIRQWGWNGKKGYRLNKYICYSVSRCNKTMIKDENCSNRKDLFNVSDLDALVLEEIKNLSLDPAALDAIIEAGDGAGLYNLVHSLIEKVVVLNGNITIYWAFC